MKTRYIIFIIGVALAIGLMVVLNVMIKESEKNVAEMMEITITDPDLSLLDDGEYVGSYGGLPISVKVRVTIVNHAITEIIISEHKNGQGSDAEAIIGTVISEQSLAIDLISGATYSSKAILLAINDALRAK